MRPRLIIALLSLVLGPVAVLTALGVKVTRDEREVKRAQIEGLLRERLELTAGQIGRFVQKRERQLDELTTLPSVQSDVIRARMRSAPFVDQIFVQRADGELTFPSLDGPLSTAERAFLRRTEQLWTQGDAFAVPSETTTHADARPASGWYTWYRDNGLGLIYWQRDPAGRTVGAELGRVRMLADIVAELPSTEDGRHPGSRITLTDARGHVVYQWGAHEPAPGEEARVAVALSAPLSTWKLQTYMSRERLAAEAGGPTALATAAGIVAVALALAGLAIYLYREGTRQIRAAEQRVSFVNQVSHELKTPLTNIRMYAEMLEGEIDPDDTRAGRHLGIIVSESQRLSRLIGNVLTFARQHRGALELRPRPTVVDRVIEEVLAQFAPSLAQKEIAVAVAGAAPTRVQADADVIAQILANLISNVEKYGAAGKRLELEVAQTGDRTTVRVRDHGAGIPPGRAAEVFRPFVRLRNDVTEGVSGAGIGLGLARDLARLHGGDLVLLPAASGTHLELTLHTPRVEP